VSTSVQHASRSRHEADVEGRQTCVGLAAKARTPSRARQSIMALRGMATSQQVRSGALSAHGFTRGA